MSDDFSNNQEHLTKRNQVTVTPESNDPVVGLAQIYLEKSPSDVFSDLSKLRLPQNFEAVGVTPGLMTVPVRKSTRTEFIRVHPTKLIGALTRSEVIEKVGYGWSVTDPAWASQLMFSRGKS